MGRYGADLTFLRPFFTFRAHRRWVLRDLATASGGIGEGGSGSGSGLRATAEAELAFCTEAAKRHPKNYQSWAHRQWVHAWEAGSTIGTAVAPRETTAAYEREPRAATARVDAASPVLLAPAGNGSLLEHDFRATMAWTGSNVSDCCSFHHIIHLLLLACARDHSGRSTARPGAAGGRAVAQEAGVAVTTTPPANEDAEGRPTAAAAATLEPPVAATGMGVDAMCMTALRHGTALTVKYGAPRYCLGPVFGSAVPNRSANR